MINDALYTNDKTADNLAVWDYNSSCDKVLVFLHGYQSKKESFYYQVQYFKRYFRVIAIDMRGFGKAKKLDKPWRVEDYAKEIEEYLKDLGINKCSIIAHSFGGRVAFKLIQRGKVDIISLVLVGGAGMKPRRNLKYLYRVLKYRLCKLFKIKTKKVGSNEYRALTGVERQTFVNVVNEHFESVAKGIKIPTLLVYGSRDKQTPPYMGRRLRKLIKGSKLYIMKGQGHFCFCIQWALFNNVTHTFLKGV